MSSSDDRDRLGQYVTERRRTKYGSVEAAIRAAEVNRVTWRKVELGEAVRDASLSAIEKSLGWNPGDAWRVMAGKEPTAEMQATPEVRQHVDLRQQIASELADDPFIRNAMLSLLDAHQDIATRKDEGRRSG